MAEHHVRMTIGSKTNLTGFEKVKGAIRGMGQSIKKAASTIGTNLMNIKAGFDMLRSAVSTVMEGLKKSFEFESLTRQFKFFLGNMEEAKQHMQDLKELGATPPFSLEEFAAASRSMMTFSNGILGMKESLKLVGDVAAGINKPVEEVGEAVAKAYAMIRDGEPVKRVVSQLRNMAAITPEAASRLEALQAEGASGYDIWNELTNELHGFDGAMDEMGETAQGSLGALQSAWDDAVRTVGESASETLVPIFKDVTKWIRYLEENGTLDDWAEDVKTSLQGVIEMLKSVGAFFSDVWTLIKGTFGTAMAFAAGMDEAGRNGEGWFNFKAGAATASEFWNTSVKGNQNQDEARWDAEERERRKKAREERARKRAEEEARMIREDLEGGKGAAGKTKKQDKSSTASQSKLTPEQKEAQRIERLQAEQERERTQSLKEEFRDFIKALKEGRWSDAEGHGAQMMNLGGKTTEYWSNVISTYKNLSEKKKSEENKLDKTNDRLKEIKEKLQEIKDQEKELEEKGKEYRRKTSEADNGDGSDGRTAGQRRHDARHDEMQKQRAQAKAERRAEWHDKKMRDLNAKERMSHGRSGRLAGMHLSSRQRQELDEWRKQQRDNRKLGNLRKTKKELEEERKQLEQNAKELPNNVKSIKDQMSDFINQQKLG